MAIIDDKILEGIKNGRRTFKGPKVVQVDLTGRCNCDCIGCWVHSPHIKEPPRDKNLVLPLERVRELIEQLSYLETEQIFISGAGEPFLHPDIMEIIELIKAKGFKLNIITNFTLIDEAKAKRLIELGVDLVTASIWAGTPGTYASTHPNRRQEDFLKIKENLIRLARLKAKTNKDFPLVKIYNVICNRNRGEIAEMINFALDAQVEFIEFQVMDIIEGATDFLKLTPGQADQIREQFQGLKLHKDIYFKELAEFDFSKEKELLEFPGRFIKLPRAFSIQESTKQECGVQIALHSLKCLQGLSTLPTKVNPLIEELTNRMTFYLPNENCRNCPAFGAGCPVDQEGKISFKYLKILGFGSFIRRINSADLYRQVYEKDVIDTLPCYVGWVYSRVLSTGEVIPCCKSEEMPLGNINKTGFRNIWESRQYREFRHNAKNMPKNKPYFKQINCYRACDNVGMNSQIQDFISQRIRLKEKEKGIPEVSLSAKINRGVPELPPAEIKIVFSARDFKAGNLNCLDDSFGEGMVLDGGLGFGFAEYQLDFKEAGSYELWSRYASGDLRPVEVHFDENLIRRDGLGFITSGWSREYLGWFKEASLDIPCGRHTLKIFTRGFIPHVHTFAFLKIPDDKKRRPGLSENIIARPSALMLLKEKLKGAGFLSTTRRLLDYVGSGRLSHDYLDILGIYNGEYAFCGPTHVQIDLTNNCNNDCIGCWCNSPLLEEKALDPVAKRQTLPLGLVKEFLDELSGMGTKEIYFSGGGEPFVHPKIMEILEYAKRKNFTCYVNTNFTLLDKERIKRLVDLGVDHLTVSTWASCAKTYAATHPNKSEETFRRIIENLKFLNCTKRKTPYIKLYNVIFNLNYHELKDMVRLAKETGSESLEFTLIDTMPGKTDKLLLNARQIEELQRDAREIEKTADEAGYWDGVLLFRFDAFLRRISSERDLSKATYDRNIIDKIPCYIGWCFTRIMPNGDVNACLKAHRIPTGNIYEERFSRIWNGSRQREFRRKTLVYKKEDPFFRLIGNDPGVEEAGCYKSCDDIGRNTYIHNRIMSLTFPERQALKLAAKIIRKPKIEPDTEDPCGHSEDLVIKGILNARKAFCGPEQVAIDLTNRCNEKCIGCWMYSPLLSERPKTECLNQEMDFEKAKALISDLAETGTKRIRFTGGGEPFMHPKIMELLEYTKDKGLICCVTTNFSVMNKERVKELIRLEIDELAISLWASSSQTYQKTHPGVSADIFERIKENLMLLTRQKKDKPFTTLCNVICNINYSEIEEMFGFAQEANADAIYFTLVDTLKGTEPLLLDRSQRQQALRQTEAIKKLWQNLPPGKRIKLDYFDGFVCRLKEESSSMGDYDFNRANNIPCYAGWIFCRILADGEVAPCCRGVKKPMGNINRQGFKDIWFGRKYDEFRAKAKFLPKTDPYFSEIGCTKMCDNLMHNEEAHTRINAACGRR